MSEYFLVTRPPGAEHLKNPHGIHAAFVEAEREPDNSFAANAIRAANALVPHLNEPFAGYDVTPINPFDYFLSSDVQPEDLVLAPQCVFQGDALGATYTGPGRGA